MILDRLASLATVRGWIRWIIENWNEEKEEISDLFLLIAYI